MLAFVPVDSMFMGIHRHVVYLQPYGVLVNICEKNRDESHIYFFIIIMILILYPLFKSSDDLSYLTPFLIFFLISFGHLICEL